MMAKVMMADELTKLQDVYLLAVTRHVILQREVDAYIVSSTVSTMSNPAEEATERTVRRRHRKGASRGRRQELAGERRERLLETAAKVAPPVGYDNPEGNLAGVRCVKRFRVGLGGGALRAWEKGHAFVCGVSLVRLRGSCKISGTVIFTFVAMIAMLHIPDFFYPLDAL